MRFKGSHNQVRYRPKDPVQRREYDPDFQPVMIGDLRRRGELLEIGCKNCGRHGYYDLTTMHPRLRREIKPLTEGNVSLIANR